MAKAKRRAWEWKRNARVPADTNEAQKAVPGRYVDQRQKTGRAFRAYVDLMDTADWMRDRMSRQLETFELTMLQFRVLETIYRLGPQYQQALSRRFECSKQNVAWVLKQLRRMGWIRRGAGRLAKKGTERTVDGDNGRSASLDRLEGVEDKQDSGISNGDEPNRNMSGRRIMQIRLTAEGRHVIEYVFPKHAKVVKSEMRALDGREQQTLSRLCQKLRKGNLEKFLREMMMVDPEEMEEWRRGNYRVRDEEW